MCSVLADSVAARPIGAKDMGTWAPSPVMSHHYMTSVSDGSAIRQAYSYLLHSTRSAPAINSPRFP